MIRSVLHRFATPFTLGIFAIAAISGTLLFLHVGVAYVHEMHEWLSMLLLVPFGLHLWKNWAQIVGYLRRGALVVPLAISGVLAGAFVAPALVGPSGGGDPGAVAVRLMMDAPLSSVAKLLDTPSAALAEKLRARGYTVSGSEATLGEIARASGQEPWDLMSDLGRLK